jgi:hypothetical protein
MISGVADISSAPRRLLTGWRRTASTPKTTGAGFATLRKLALNDIELIPTESVFPAEFIVQPSLFDASCDSLLVKDDFKGAVASCDNLDVELAWSFPPSRVFETFSHDVL